MTDELITVAEAAKLLGKSRHAVYHLIYRQRLPVVEQQQPRYMLRREDVEVYAEQE